MKNSLFDVGDIVSFTIYENEFEGEIEKVDWTFDFETGTMTNRIEYHIRGESTNHPEWEHAKPIVTRTSHRPLTLVKKREK